MRLKTWVDNRSNITIKALAEGFGIRRVALHRAMSGQTLPRRETIERIERVTGGAVTAADLFEAHAEFWRTHPTQAALARTAETVCRAEAEFGGLA